MYNQQKYVVLQLSAGFWGDLNMRLLIGIRYGDHSTSTRTVALTTDCGLDLDSPCFLNLPRINHEHRSCLRPTHLWSWKNGVDPRNIHFLSLLHCICINQYFSITLTCCDVAITHNRYFQVIYIVFKILARRFNNEYIQNIGTLVFNIN